jgi:hypothetical protein
MEKLIMDFSKKMQLVHSTERIPSIHELVGPGGSFSYDGRDDDTKTGAPGPTAAPTA